MAEKTAEHLSALIDGECPTAEIDLALRRIAKETELQTRWQRYHLISDALNHNLPDKMDSEFCHRIRHAIENDAVPLQSTMSPRAGWYKPFAGVAIAASLVAAITLTLEFGTGEPGATGPKSGATPPLADATPLQEKQIQEKQLSASVIAGPSTKTVSAELESRINRYLISHNEQASMTSLHGIMPYVTMVSAQGGR